MRLCAVCVISASLLLAACDKPTTNAPDLSAVDLGGTLLDADVAIDLVSADQAAAPPDLFEPDLTAPPDLVSPAVLESDRSALDFSRVAVGASSSPILVQLTNNGTGASGVLTLGTGDAAFLLSNDGCSTTTLAPMASCSFEVSFAPTALGLRTATLSFGVPGPAVMLGGEGIAPGALGSDDTPYSYPETQVGASNTKVFVIRNQGATAVDTIAVNAPVGGATDEFTLVVGQDTCTGATIAPDATCLVEVRFAPGTRGGKNANVQITSSGGELNLSLAGVGRQAALSVATNPLAVGSVGEAGSASTQATLALTNTGDYPIAADTITFALADETHFSATHDCAAGLAPSAACTITVTFHPEGALGALGTDLTVTAAGAEHSPLVIGLTGTSLGPPVLALTPTPPLVFGNSLLTVASATQLYTVTNTGETATGLLGVTLTGTDASSFLLTGTEPGVRCAALSALAPAATCQVALAFRPTSAGTKTAVNLAISNATGATATFTGIATGFGCVDADGDGFFTDATCGPTDCDDANPNRFAACGTDDCVDVDGDNHFAGCDRYTTVYADCDDSDATLRAPMEIVGNGIDEDCDGHDLVMNESEGFFVAPTGNDTTGNGSRAAPYATIAKAWQQGTPTRHATFVMQGAYQTTFDTTALPYREMWIYGGYDGTWTRGAETDFVVKLSNSGAATPVLRLRGAVGLDRVTVSQSAFANTIELGAGQFTFAEARVLAGRGSIGVQIGSTTRAQFTGSVMTTAGLPTPTDTIFDVAASGRLGVFGSSLDAYSSAVRGSGHIVIADGSTITGGQGGNAGIFHNGSSTSAEPNGSLRIADSNMQWTGSAAINVGLPTEIVGSVIETTQLYALFSTNGNVDLINAVMIGSVYVSRDQSTNVTADTLRAINTSIVATAANLPAMNVTGANLTAKLVNNILNTSLHFNALHYEAGTATLTLLNNAIFSNMSNCPLSGASCIAAANLNACGFAGCASASGNVNVECPLDASHHLTNASCVGGGTDPSTYYATSFTDIDGQARPISAWDIGPDEQ